MVSVAVTADEDGSRKEPWFCRQCPVKVRTSARPLVRFISELVSFVLPDLTGTVNGGKD